MYYPRSDPSLKIGEDEELDSMKKMSSLSGTQGQYGGSWFRRFKSGVDNSESNEISRESRPGKKLDEFYDDGDLSERDEDDIYRHYQEIASR